MVADIYLNLDRKKARLRPDFVGTSAGKFKKELFPKKTTHFPEYQTSASHASRINNFGLAPDFRARTKTSQ